jgi:putative ABC transport system permease protein
MKDSPPQALRPVPFALRLIAHQKTRSAVAAAGIAFALLVIFMQLGFYGAVLNTALAISSHLNAELILISPRFVHLNETGTIPRGRIFQALGHPDVASASPLYIRYAIWRDADLAKHCRLAAVAFPIDNAQITPPLLMPEVMEQLDTLRTTNKVLLDRMTQRGCGPSSPIGDAEINGRAVQVTGGFELGVGFLADGAVITSDDTFSRLFQLEKLDRPHLGLVKLRDGADPEEVAAALRAQLPADVRVISRNELEALQTQQWVRNTAVGNIFEMGSLAGFLLGVVVLFQILSADIRNQLPLYATLRAMGYTNARLYRYALELSWIFAGLGYVPALMLTLILFPIVHRLTLLPIYVTVGLTTFVFVLSFVMCSLAAILSMRRLRMADPAELF